MMANNLVIVLLYSFVLAACTTKLKPVEYKEWLENPESGLVQERNISKLKIKAYYRPESYMAFNDLGANDLNDSILESTKKEYHTMQYYELIISMDSTDFIKNQSTDKNDYINNLYYYTFNFKDDISLVYQDSVHVPVSLYHFERSYGLTYSKKFLIGFENKEEIGGRSIKIDSPLLPTGVVYLFFDKKNIERASAIEITL